jgi:hypothetical protein
MMEHSQLLGFRKLFVQRLPGCPIQGLSNTYTTRTSVLQMQLNRNLPKTPSVFAPCPGWAGCAGRAAVLPPLQSAASWWPRPSTANTARSPHAAGPPRASGSRGRPSAACTGCPPPSRTQTSPPRRASRNCQKERDAGVGEKASFGTETRFLNVRSCRKVYGFRSWKKGLIKSDSLCQVDRRRSFEKSFLKL